MHTLLKNILLTTALIPSVFSHAAPAAPIDWTSSNAKVIHNNMVDPYGQLALSTKTLVQRVEMLCRNISTEEKNNNKLLRHAQSSFKESYLHWAAVQHITIGPMAYLQRKERFQYWPDKHKVAGRQIKRLLSNILHAEPLTLENFQQKSVAVQGLPALERLLFSSKGNVDKKDCYLASLASKNVHEIAKNNYMAWISSPVKFANELLNPHPSLGIYPSQDVIAEIFFSQLTTQLLILEKLKLERVLDKPNKKAKPRNLEAWRSRLSLPLIQQNLMSLQDLYLNGFHPHLHITNKVLAEEIRLHFTKSISLTQGYPSSLHDTLQQEKKSDRATLLMKEIAHLYQLTAVEMSKALRFSTKFNALDGD